MDTVSDQLLLGIDTGGTYTDAVLYRRSEGVIAKAKSLTTKNDLSVGITGAIEGALAKTKVPAGDIKLVSISTTLATNALVEGKGNSVGLIMIGFEEADLDKAGLREALGTDPVLFLKGGHNVHGNETPLEIDPLSDFLEDNRTKINGVAIVGLFAVRNAGHENRVRELVLEKTDLPCTCSHELSSKLGGPKRALTTLLNARLVPMITSLIQATRSYLTERNIRAPLMVVRGDGTMVSSDFALSRPIETILSGPAASLIGVKHLIGSQNAVVSDIGGTTTDIAILEEGWPRLEPNGAMVGGFQTMVEAVAMHTYGLGGDSVLSVSDDTATKLILGPKRQIPISLLAKMHPEIVHAELTRQKQVESPNHLHARFAFLVDDGAPNGTLKQTESKLLAKLTSIPQALDTLLKGNSEYGTLNKLINKGLVLVSGFTPSDASHVLKLQDNWDRNAAEMAASIFAKQKDRFGNHIASNEIDLCKDVTTQLTNQSTDCIINTCMTEDEFELGPTSKALIERSLNRTGGFVSVNVALDRPLVGVGASAKLYYPAIGERLNTETMLPSDGDVANAIGAVSGEIRIVRKITVSSADGGNSFQVLGTEGPITCMSQEEAFDTAKTLLQALVKSLMEQSNATDIRIEFSEKIDEAIVENQTHFVQAEITCVGEGLPKLGAK